MVLINVPMRRCIVFVLCVFQNGTNIFFVTTDLLTRVINLLCYYAKKHGLISLIICIYFCTIHRNRVLWCVVKNALKRKTVDNTLYIIDTFKFDSVIVYIGRVNILEHSSEYTSMYLICYRLVT